MWPSVTLSNAPELKSLRMTTVGQWCALSICVAASVGELDQTNGYKLRERKSQAEVDASSRSARDFSCQLPGRADSTGENKNVSPTTNSEPNYIRLCCLGRPAPSADSAVPVRHARLCGLQEHHLHSPERHVISISLGCGTSQSFP